MKPTFNRLSRKVISENCSTQDEKDHRLTIISYPQEDRIAEKDIHKRDCLSPPVSTSPENEAVPEIIDIAVRAIGRV